MKGQFVRVTSDKELSDEKGKNKDYTTLLSKSPTPKRQIDKMLDGVERELNDLRLQNDLVAIAYNVVMWNRRLTQLIAESRKTC